MLSGSFALGGGDTMPLFEPQDNLVGARDKGHLTLSTDIQSVDLSIPSRDKTVQIYSNHNNLSTFIETIDSNFSGLNYQSKLGQFGFEPDQYGLVVNKGSHGSFALFGPSISVVGLHDTELKNSYITWSSDDSIIKLIRKYPLRFLVYRFPPITDPIFVQAEAVCSKWWRWIRTHHSHLHAFNALEHKLFGHQ